MVQVPVEISEDAFRTLGELAAASGRAPGELLADLIEQERRRRMLDEANAAFARLRADPAAWADYQDEIRSMEGTLMDGLEDDPWEE